MQGSKTLGASEAEFHITVKDLITKEMQGSKTLGAIEAELHITVKDCNHQGNARFQNTRS